MKMMNLIRPIFLVLGALAVLAACGPKSIPVKDHKYTTDISGLKLDASEAPTILYKRAGVPGLDAYNRFIIDPVQVVYDDPAMDDLTPEQIGKMQEYLFKAMIKELRDAGYEVGTRSQANTMRVSFTISGLKASDKGGAANAATMAAGMAIGVPIGIYAINVGEVTVEGIFREALTNRIDAVVVSHSAGNRLFKDKFWSTWADVEGAFDNWAKGFREAVDKAHRL